MSIAFNLLEPASDMNIRSFLILVCFQVPASLLLLKLVLTLIGSTLH